MSEGEVERKISEHQIDTAMTEREKAHDRIRAAELTSLLDDMKAKSKYCPDCRKRHSWMGVLRIEHSMHGCKSRIVSLPISHCTDIKIILMKQGEAWKEKP